MVELMKENADDDDDWVGEGRTDGDEEAGEMNPNALEDGMVAVVVVVDDATGAGEEMNPNAEVEAGGSLRVVVVVVVVVPMKENADEGVV